MKRKWLSFKYIYLIYLALLVAAVIGAVTYVRGLLREYEDGRPEAHAEKVMEELVAAAAEGDFWSKYAMPKVKAGKFEEHLDVKKEYLSLYTDGKAEVSQKGGAHAEDELIYVVEHDGVALAEIKLKAAGEAVTKLAVLSFREWQVESVTPIFEEHDYTIAVPSDFIVSVNGMKLTAEDGVASSENEITYTVSDVYGKPVFDITDKDGNAVTYAVDNGQVIAEFYYYALTLPAALTVEVNGESCQGEELDGKRVRYDIKELTRPTINISDYYGNVISYEGGAELPLTYMTITADSRCTVKVAGVAVPKKAITSYANPDYEPFADYVENLPQISVYDIVVLKEDAEITVADADGNPVELAEGEAVQDLTSRINGLAEVPGEVSAEVDVLEIAQNWSLFMSRDYPFEQMKQHMIENSYQYKVARKYATGVDITFISAHTLKNPAFTGNSVTNFTWLTDNCFSVDISFVKHMVLSRTGASVDDPMNDRFYFVKYDDTNDNIDNPTWKIASMKEIVNNEK